MKYLGDLYKFDLLAILLNDTIDSVDQKACPRNSK